MEPLLPNEQRARSAILLIWIVMGLDFLSIISGYFQYELLNSVKNGSEISTEAANANDLREQAIAIIYLVAYIISAIMFIRWFRRAYYNLSLRAKRLSYSDGMASGAWFIPVVNLFRPYKIMKEMYEETSTLLFTKNIQPEKELETTRIGWWWALWIFCGILGRIYSRLLLDANTVDEYISSTIMSMISDAISIPLALITVKVIKDYAAVEPLLIEIRDTETPPALNDASASI